LKFPDHPILRSGDGVAKDGNDTAGFVVDVNEGAAVNAVFAFPADCESRVGLLKVNMFRIAIACQSRR
jgi:hypothetical protein